jgi:hypothetical protein
MLRNPGLRAILEAQPYVCFEVKDDEGWFGSKFPDGVDALSRDAGHGGRFRAARALVPIIRHRVAPSELDGLGGRGKPGHSLK